MIKKINLAGEKFNLVETFDKCLTVPDCIVNPINKIGNANGEAKFYIASKEQMREFFNGGISGFKVRCFVLKSDLLNYMNAIKTEYLNPTQIYRGLKELPELWNERMMKILALPDIIEFDMFDQTQIEGERGYVNTSIRKDKRVIAEGSKEGYSIIREIALPLVSYISIMQLTTSKGTNVFYWKLFVDYDAITTIANGPLVLKYGKKQENNPHPQTNKRKQVEITNARVGQGKYRDELLLECQSCPITGINDDRLLIASHIKPWIVSNDKEKVDPKNGFILSPLYDKLFDKGFITFTDERRVILSNWISPNNYKRIGIKDNDFFQKLPIDDERKIYLKYHRECVFKG